MDVPKSDKTRFEAEARNSVLWSLGQVLKLSWLEAKTEEGIDVILHNLLPAFACGCVENGDFVSLQVILEKMDINQRSYDGTTTLHKACEQGSIYIVMYLQRKGACIQQPDLFGQTPLHLAITNKHYHVIRYLVSKGATLALTPVRIAVNLIKLVSHTHNLSAPFGKQTCSFMVQGAVRERDYQLLKAWSLAGVNMDAQDYNGNTAMHVAVQMKDSTMVAMLLKLRATPLERDTWSRSAVDEAHEHNLKDILRLFHPLFTEQFTEKETYQKLLASLRGTLL